MIGRIGTWDGSDEWENWRGDDVTNEWYGFRFNDADWQYLAEFHGGERYVTPDGGAQYLDESWTNVYSEVYAPQEGASEEELAAWAVYDPDVSDEFDGEGVLLLDFNEVDYVRAGTETRTYYETPDYVEDGRSEESSNTYVRYNYNVKEPVDHNNDEIIDWYDHRQIGTLEQRDGFVEIYDEHWTLIARRLDPSAGKSADEIFAEVAGLEAAWTDIANYLPADAQDAAALTFSSNEWNEVFVFDTSGELLLRINNWSNVDY